MARGTLTKNKKCKALMLQHGSFSTCDFTTYNNDMYCFDHEDAICHGDMYHNGIRIYPALKGEKVSKDAKATK